MKGRLNGRFFFCLHYTYKRISHKYQSPIKGKKMADVKLLSEQLGVVSLRQNRTQDADIDKGADNPKTGSRSTDADGR